MGGSTAGGMELTGARLLAAALFLGLVAIAVLMPSRRGLLSPLQPKNVRYSERKTPVQIPGSRSDEAARRIEFQRFLAEGYQALGRDVELESATDLEKEHYSPALLRSSEWLGGVAERLEKEPAFAREALYFYAKCSADESLLIAVRAVCYRNVIEVAAKNAISLKQLAFDPEAVGRDVKELAARIP